MSYPAEYFIRNLNLQPHPEGGYFAETYRSGEFITSEALPSAFGGNRNISTAIYFLLEGKQFSGFHRIKSDEIWHFYFGIPLIVYIIHPDGNLETLKIVVKAGCWFASKPINDTGFSLVGCTVAPGFDFCDFELADARLAKQYPEHRELILKLVHV